MRSNLSTILLIIFSGINFILFIFIAASLLLIRSFEFLPQPPINSLPDQSFLQVLKLIIFGLLIAPMGYFNFRHLLGKPENNVELRNHYGRVICFLTATWFILALSTEKMREARGDWIRIPEILIYLILVFSPIIIILWIGLRGIPMGSRRRVWTIFGLGFVLGPFLILVSEIIVVIISAIVAVIIISKKIALDHELMVFLDQFAGINSIEGIQELLIPFLSNPWVILSLLVFVSLIIPMVEEFLKPAGTWLVAKKNMKPQDGFVMGILSGTGYALFETLSASGTMGDKWGMILMGRAGTDLLHIFNTGLMGWAMISDWKISGWIKLICVYVLTIFIHGLWNSLTLTLSLSNYFRDVNGIFGWLKYSDFIGNIGLLLLVLIMLIGLWVINQKFRDMPLKKMMYNRSDV